MAVVSACLAALSVCGETTESAKSSQANSSTAPAYLRSDAGSSREAVMPVVESLPSTLNSDFAEKSTSKTDSLELTETDIVLKKEQRNWLTVGVMKLSGDYQPEADLTEEEEKELEEKRASFYSPTMFVDHFARIERAKESRVETAQTDWNSEWNTPNIGQPLDFSMGRSHEPISTTATPASGAPRVNPYLKSLNLDQPERTPVSTDLGTSRWNESAPNETARFQAMAPVDMNRSRTEPSAQSNWIVPDSGSLATESPKQLAPKKSPERREKDIDEKYFRNLDRF